MVGKKTIGKVAASLILGGMVLVNGSAAFAQNTKSSGYDKKSAYVQHFNGFNKYASAKKLNNDSYKTMLDGLVTAGTITQSQEDAIINYMQQRADEMKAQMDKLKSMTSSERQAYIKENRTKQKTDFLADLVSQNIITQEQADAIKQLMTSKIHKNVKENSNIKNDRIKNILDSYVTAGTISSEQENKIISYMQQKADEMKAQMDKLKSMTPSERQAYIKENKPQMKFNMLADLVAQEIITQDQANAMQKLNPQVKVRNNTGDMKSKLSSLFKTKLDSLVTSGTITQDQETAVMNLLIPSTDNMAGSDKQKGGLKAKLDSLVTAGTITQDQKNAILNLFTHHSKKTTQTQQ